MRSDIVITLLSTFVILSILFAGFYIAYKADIENIYIFSILQRILLLIYLKIEIF